MKSKADFFLPFTNYYLPFTTYISLFTAYLFYIHGVLSFSTRNII